MNHIRQGQNNNSKRSRGRGRKPQNSGNRAYDSNGPDVKIRGTATHICEKYQQLARDAITSGDRVMAENYYQHAEHYYRLIMANQAPNDGQPRPQNALGYRPDDDQDFDEDEGNNDGVQPNVANQPHHQQQQNGNGNGDRDRRNNNRRRDRNQPNQSSGGNPFPGNDASQQDGNFAAEAETPIEEQPQPEVVELEGDAPVADATAEQPRRRPVRRRRPRSDSAKAESAGGEADAGQDEVTA